MATNAIDVRANCLVGQAMYMSVKVGEAYSASFYRHTKKNDILVDIPIKCLIGEIDRHSRGDYSQTMGESIFTPAGVRVCCMIALDRSETLGDCMGIFWEIGSHNTIEKYYPLFVYCCKCLAVSLGMKVKSLVVWPSPYGAVLEVRIFHYIDRGAILPLNRLGFI